MDPTVTTTTESPLWAEKINGIYVLVIVSGLLIVILIAAFLLAYRCKWKTLLDAVEEQKLAKQKTKREKESVSSDSMLANYD